MRRVTSKLFKAGDGSIVEASLIEAPNVDDVLLTEAKIEAYNIWKAKADPDRRVGRDVRDVLLRFGVQR